MSRKKIVIDFSDNEQIAVSYVTAQLMEWLGTHDQETIKRLLAKAYVHAVQKKETHALSAEEFGEIVVNFLSLLELLTKEILEETEVKDMFQRALIPTLKQLDGDSFKKGAVDESADKALDWARTTRQNPKKYLCRELLRRWKPSKKRTAQH